MTDFFHVRWTPKDFWTPLFVGKFGWFDYGFSSTINNVAFVVYAVIAIAALVALIPRLRRDWLLVVVYAGARRGPARWRSRASAIRCARAATSCSSRPATCCRCSALYALALALAFSWLRGRALVAITSIAVGAGLAAPARGVRAHHPPLLPVTLPPLLVTGGAGFVGANLCLALAAAGDEVIALDSLKRRGSELNLARLREAGVAFVHGDVRERADLLALEPVEAIVECSAEPSVLAGMGTRRRLRRADEPARRAQLPRARAPRRRAVRVPLDQPRLSRRAAARGSALREGETRFELEAEQPLAGASEHGIAEDFPLGGARTLYGATKLAAELLVAEYADAFGVRAMIDRCGVIAGPWQMGKVDQGVFTHWLLAHRLGRPLTYIGYGGSGQAGARPAARRRPVRADRSSSSPTRGLGRRDGQRRRRRRGQPVAARDDGAVPRADRQRGADRAGARAARRATCRSTRPTAARCSRAPTGGRRAGRGRSSRTRWRGSRPTSARC